MDGAYFMSTASTERFRLLLIRGRLLARVRLVELAEVSDLCVVRMVVR